MGVGNKAALIRELRREHQIPQNEILFVGDDVNDCSVREECGLLYAVNDAAEELKEIADIILRTKGGFGVIQEVLNKIHEH